MVQCDPSNFFGVYIIRNDFYQSSLCYNIKVLIGSYDFSSSVTIITLCFRSLSLAFVTLFTPKPFPKKISRTAEEPQRVHNF
jgi:hypothetical protein